MATGEVVTILAVAQAEILAEEEETLVEVARVTLAEEEEETPVAAVAEISNPMNKNRGGEARFSSSIFIHWIYSCRRAFIAPNVASQFDDDLVCGPVLQLEGE